jgi:2',3'-cyclic-nucleotide 2'-phosphodiesterase
MNILYVGDIMGEPGIEVVEGRLQALRNQHAVDLVIAQGENVSAGKGMKPSDMKRLQKAGVDFFTGGNHTPASKPLHQFLKNDESPVIGPANMPDSPGKGWKYLSTPKGRVLIISILGATVGREVTIRNPLQCIDQVLALNQGEDRAATIVNFHGDYSSEKVIIGHYLDGRVTAVIGDHWHVPTADATVLPKGTAHISDVGMCGVLHASLGVTLESVIPRWRDGIQTKNELAAERPYQLNAVLIETDERSGLAHSIVAVREILS